MNKFIAMIILKPDIQEKQIDFIQSDIVSLFEQKSKIQKVWYLGKRNLDHKIKKYKEGLFLKIELLAKSSKLDGIREQLKANQSIIFSIIINNEDKKRDLPKLPVLLKKKTLPFNRVNTFNQIEQNPYSEKVYMLISKNLKLPFTESNILAVSHDRTKIFQEANEKIKQYIYAKGYCTTKEFKNIKDVEKELERTYKVEFILGQSPNVGQELFIKEQYLI